MSRSLIEDLLVVLYRAVHRPRPLPHRDKLVQKRVILTQNFVRWTFRNRKSERFIRISFVLGFQQLQPQSVNSLWSWNTGYDRSNKTPLTYGTDQTHVLQCRYKINPTLQLNPSRMKNFRAWEWEIQCRLPLTLVERGWNITNIFSEFLTSSWTKGHGATFYRNVHFCLQ